MDGVCSRALGFLLMENLFARLQWAADGKG